MASITFCIPKQLLEGSTAFQNMTLFSVLDDFDLKQMLTQLRMIEMIDPGDVDLRIAITLNTISNEVVVRVDDFSEALEDSGYGKIEGQRLMMSTTAKFFARSATTNGYVLAQDFLVNMDGRMNHSYDKSGRQT